MIVLVTGANGFVGRHLCRALKARGDTVIGVDMTMPDPAFCDEHWTCHDSMEPALLRIFADQRVDWVFHLAAMSHLPSCHQNARGAFETNVRNTFELLHTATKAGYPVSLVLAGSGEEYGDTHQGLAREWQAPLPLNFYGATKAAAAALAIGFANAHRDQLRVRVARMSNVYGPGQQLPKFVPLAFERLAARQDLTLHNFGLVSRDWLYVDDAVDALIRLAMPPHESWVEGPNPIYNVSTGRAPESLKLVATEIARNVAAAQNRPLDSVLRCILYVAGGSITAPVTMSPARLDVAYGWRACVSLTRGLELTAAHFFNRSTDL